MGKNNRQRRQEKQRKKKAQKRQHSPGPGARLLRQDVAMLCGVVEDSLDAGEAPPPEVMKRFHSWAEDPQLGRLQQLLAGFLEYLFAGAQPTGNPATLAGYRQAMENAGYDWLYGLLHPWCLLSHPALQQGDMRPLADFAASQPLSPASLAFDIVLHLRGGDTDTDLKRLLTTYLRDTEAASLARPLHKFLCLKQPRPQLKTVTELEGLLAQVEWHPDSPWRDGIKAMIGLYIEDKPGMQMTPEQWSRLPALAQLQGKRNDGGDPRVPLTGPGASRLLNLEKFTDKTALNYRQRLQYELLRCRFLGEYADGSGRGAFEKQLDALFTLCCSGVPAGEASMARQCVDNLTEWLCRETQARRLPLPSARILRLPCRHNPQDYRLALLNFLGRGGATDPGSPYRHVHAGLFCFALQQVKDPDKLLAHFYWPLTGEHKKTLAIYTCRELLLAADDERAQKLWHRLHNTLFDPGREPLADVLEGRPCEAEWLFYAALITAGRGANGGQWIREDQVAVLLRAAGRTFGPDPAGWTLELLGKLWEQLGTTHGEAMLEALDPLCGLLEKFDSPAEFESCVSLLLRALEGRGDRASEQYQRFYRLCRAAYPALRRLIPAAARKSRKRSPSRNLELFGEQ